MFIIRKMSREILTTTQKMSADELYMKRLHALVGRLPQFMQPKILGLLKPERKLSRVIWGLTMLIGGCLSFLPVLGIWMLPLGLLLLAQDVPLFRRLVNRIFDMIERRHPEWLEAKQKS